MSTDTDNVIAFPGVRVAAEPATLIIGAVLAEEPQVVHRQFGINDRLTLRELSDALRVMFGWPGESAPTKFTLEGSTGLAGAPGFDAGMSVNVPLDTVIGDVLQDVGDTLTWHWGLWDHRLDVREAFARDAVTLEETRRASYSGEGWGLCEQAGRLVMSDGSSTLTFRDPATFAETGRVEVLADGLRVENLNELECVDGPDGPEVWANLWRTNDIVRIDPATGEVTGFADATPLVDALSPEARAKADVFNGIAHVPGTDHFLVTGKYWPTLFEVRFTDAG